MKTALPNLNHWKATLLFMCFALFGFAQSNTGSIRGTIKDNSGSLPGVNIQVKDLKNNGGTTNLSGEFRLNNVPAGTQTIVVSYIGYKTTEFPITVVAGKNTDMGALVLEESSMELADVVIKGTYLPSQQRALNIKKKSLGIMEVMASDAIGKLPDRNAAEAVQRMQGVSIERDQGEGRYALVRGTPMAWNSTLINGDRLPASNGTSDNSSGTRAVPLDIFPSDMIEYVQLSKALTPDMEGDAIGGSINFITKTAPQEQMLNLSVGSGFNAQSNEPMYSGSLMYGNKFGKFSIMASAAYWDRNWGSDNYEVEYNFASEDPKQQYAIDNLQLRDYLGRRTTLGLNLGMQYEFNPNHKLYARGIYSNFRDNEQGRQQDYYFLENMAEVMTRNGVIDINLSGGELGGEHNLKDGWSVDWKASTYKNEMSNNEPSTLPEDERGYTITYFQQRGVAYDGLASDGFKYLNIDDPSGDPYDNIQPQMSTEFDPSQMAMSQILSYGIQSLEQDYTGQFNVKKDVNNRLKLKAGVKYRNKERTGGTPTYIWIPGAYLGIPGSPAPATLADLDREEFPANGGFLEELGNPYEGQMIDQITMDQVANVFSEEELAEYGMFKIARDKDNPDAAPGFYEGNEAVLAAYIMGEYKLTDKITLIGGFRNENTEINYDGNQVITSVDGNGDEITTVEQVSNNRNTNAFLPMFHLKYSPKDNINLRAAYTKTFARPNFSDLNPGETRNDQTRVISKGNVDLNPTFSNNFDLMGEYYFKDVGLFSAGVFYKDITDVIFTSQSIVNLDGQNYQVNTPKNLEDAWLFGFEAGISKRLSFLPGFLSGLGVEANYTFTKSEVAIPQYSTDANGEISMEEHISSLPQQPTNIYNAALFYEKHGLMIRVAANFKDKYVDIIRQDAGPENNRWYDKNLTVDLSAAYSITPKMRVYLELNNLTNEPLRYYHGVEDRPEQVEYYSLRGQLGLRFNLF